MVIVAAGSGSRFEDDKMMTRVGGRPLVEITVRRILPHVDRCVLVCRSDQMERIESLELDVVLARGGATRTASEISGLRALGGVPDLIGIHDGARPNIGDRVVDELFETATSVGGAVPVIVPDRLLIDTGTLRPVDDVVAVQTPQVFMGEPLVRAYQQAESDGVVGHDTLAIVQRYADLEVAAVHGDPTNIKVTYPADLARVVPL